MIDSGCFLEKEFLDLICMNFSNVIYWLRHKVLEGDCVVKIGSFVLSILGD